MNKIFTLFCIMVVFYTDTYCQQQSEKRNTKSEISILFIGNSLTYTNNLPALVKKSAKKEGIKVVSQMIAFPNYAIVDHWEDGKVQQLIASKKFDYVIIQQGPSSQTEGRNMLINDGKKYGVLCEANDTRLCYFMVWPSRKYYQTFDGVIKNHQDAAAMNQAILLPVGAVWKAYFDKTKDFKYYGADGFHPSFAGSKIAAEVIVEYLLKDLQ